VDSKLHHLQQEAWNKSIELEFYMREHDLPKFWNKINIHVCINTH